MQLGGLEHFKSGKVREMYELDGGLLIVATDRISAFDWVLPDPIPGKGKVLTEISLFWFDFLSGIIENHLITADISRMPSVVHPHRELLEGRSMYVRKTEVIPVECIVRGYLAGSGWRDYRRTGKLCGIELPPGMRESEKLPEPIFTPSTKAETGHDENISEEEAERLASPDDIETIKEASLALYKRAADYALTRGIIIADTKFEFGKLPDGKIILIDEALTPDSSRFWPLEQYEPGRPQPSFDKQFVRDYLDGLDWDKNSPPPRLPAEIIEKTAEKYRQVKELLVG